MIKIFMSLVAVLVTLLVFGGQIVLAADNVQITYVSEQVELVEYSNPSSVIFEIEAVGESDGCVDWEVYDLPTGVTATFSDDPICSESLWTTALTLDSDEFALPGTYTITVSAEGDGVGEISFATFEYKIDPLTITATGVVAESKVYDATTDAVLTGTLEDLRKGDDVDVEGVFSTKTIGEGKEIELMISGPDAFKYSLEEILYADITPVTIMILAGDFAEDQTYYNGTTDAKLRVAPLGLVFDNVLPEDNVVLEGGVAEFNDKHVGEGKIVLLSNFVAGGPDGENYILDNQPADETQDVLPAPITVRPIDDTKVYDGTIDSDLEPEVTNGTVFAEDMAQFSQYFEDENVGTDKTIISMGAVNDGNDGNNYLVTHTPRNNSEITPIELNIEGLQIETKVYDKTDVATIVGEGLLQGVIDFDDVSFDVSLTTARFEDEKIGSDKEVIVDDFGLVGDDALNYTLNQPNLTGTILPRFLRVVIEGVDKVFDGNTEAEVIFYDDRLEGDELTISGESSFADSSVGTNKEVTTVNIEIEGPDAENYLVNETATTSADITEVSKKKKTGSKKRFVFNTAPVGQVFGASTSTALSATTTDIQNEFSSSTATTTFKFLNNLYFGLVNNYDVSVLQQILIDGKLLPISRPTSYFGPLTEAAVKLYQVSKGIVGTGFVGPITRAVLNKDL
jgi:hypothetical protein